MGWGTEVLLQIQSVGNSLLDAIFTAITYLGNEEFYLLLLPVLYWCLNRALAIRLAYLLLFSASLNTGFKDLFKMPRPDPAQVRRVVEASGYGFPSGHAQSTAAVWIYLATQIRSRAFWTIAILVTFLVGLSRMYLGVHYPGDVLGGWAIGLVLVALYAWLSARYGGRIARLSLWAGVALAVLAPLALMAAYPVPDVVSALSTMIGLGVGSILERQWVRFRVEGAWWIRVLRFLLGAVGLLGVYFGLKMVFPADPFFRGLRYALVGGWVALLAPWLFVAIRLAERESGDR